MVGDAFELSALLSALERIPAHAWPAPSTLAESGGHQGYRIVSLVSAGEWKPEAEPFRFVLDELAPVWTAWLSSLAAGGFILPHADEGPFRERWQVPICPAGDMNGRAAAAGVPFRVEQWNVHSVTNPTGRARIHLVVDRDVVVDPTCAPYRLAT